MRHNEHAVAAALRLMAVAPSLGRATGVESLEACPEADAAQRLYERHADRVLAYCLSRLHSREDAEDAVQTTFLYAFRALRRGVRPGIEIAWLITIARNVCLNGWDGARRRSRLEAVRDPSLLEREAGCADVDRDEVIPLRAALVALPELQRRAILLREWQGLSYREIAAELGVSQAAVETLIFRARRSLADVLGGAPEERRRRLAGINAGPLLGAVDGFKSALSGATVAAKVAAAAAVTAGVVASGVALGQVSPPARAADGLGAAGPSGASAANDAATARMAAVRTEATPPAPQPSRHADSKPSASRARTKRGGPSGGPTGGAGSGGAAGSRSGTLDSTTAAVETTTAASTAAATEAVASAVDTATETAGAVTGSAGQTVTTVVDGVDSTASTLTGAK